MLYAALEGSVLAVACMATGNPTHLTWWALALLAVFDILLALFPSATDLLARVWTASAALSTLVQLTVVLMSFMKCSMIQDALREVGPWLYFFGNFWLGLERAGPGLADWLENIIER